MKVGKVNIIGSEYSNNSVIPEEITIQLTDTIALKYILNKDSNSVSISVMNTLFDTAEFKGEIAKENFFKMIKGGKDMFSQLK